MTGKPTPAEAKAVWDSLDKPSARKVAAKFQAAGRPVSFKTVALWKREGWPGATAETIIADAAKAVEAINVALPAITGDVASKLEDVANPAKPDPESTVTSTAPAQTVTVPAPITSSPQSHNEPLSSDDRSNAERAEDALLAAITGATTVWNSITQIAVAKPPDGQAVDKDSPPLVLLMAPEGVAKLMKASSEAINMAIEGMKQIPLLRMEAAAAVPGTQTVYPPGQGPHVDEDYPLRSAMEAFDAALKGIREKRA
jgi:hypothetical protein